MPWPVLGIGENYEICLVREAGTVQGLATIVALDRGGGGRASRIEIEVAGTRHSLNNRQLLTAIANARRARRRDVWRWPAVHQAS
jgi:hypothetical protein